MDLLVHRLDPDLPLLPVTTVNEALARQFWPQRMFGSMFAIFASIAMLLANTVRAARHRRGELPFD